MPCVSGSFVSYAVHRHWRSDQVIYHRVWEGIEPAALWSRESPTECDGIVLQPYSGFSIVLSLKIAHLSHRAKHDRSDVY